MRFHVVAPSVHLQRKCNGVCRRLLRAGTWVYGCDACQLDLCAACSPEGVIPAAAPHPPRVKAARPRAQHVRAQDPPPKRRAGSGSARRGGRHAPYEAVPCLTRTATMRPSTLGRTILCGPAAMARRIRRDAALIRVRREMRWRRGAGARTRAKPRPCVAPCTGGRCTAPVPRGGARAQTRRHSLYTFARARYVNARWAPSWAVSFTTLSLPPPLCCVCSIWCLCFCAACLCLCVCAPHTAPSTLCLHGSCGCASCRDGKLT